MEEIHPLCGYEHRIIAELKKRLSISSFQLESIKKEAELERKEHEAIVQSFIQLLSIAYQERDQLQKLVNKFMSYNNNNHNPILDQIEPTPLLIQQPKPNLSITESNSENNNNNNNNNNNPLSHASSSSPADNNSFFDAATSPDFSTMNLSGTSSTAHVQDCIIFPRFDIDRANAAIEHLVKGKPLPQKGNLQQSVIDAGPLLYTLFMTGSIPQWKNPPSLLRPFINNNNNNMQPSVKGNKVIPAASLHAKKKADLNSTTFPAGFKTLNPALYDKNRRASAAVILESMSNSAGGASASGWSNKQMVNSIACTNSQNSKDKRQRLI